MSELCRKPNNKYILWYIKSRLKEHTKQTMLLMKFVNTGKKWIQIWNILSSFLPKLIVFFVEFYIKGSYSIFFRIISPTRFNSRDSIENKRFSKIDQEAAFSSWFRLYMDQNRNQVENVTFRSIFKKCCFAIDFWESGEFNFGGK